MKILDSILPRCCTVCGRTREMRTRITFDIPAGMEICGRCLSSVIPNEKSRRWLLVLSEPYENDPYPAIPLYLPFDYGDFFKCAIPAVKFRKIDILASFCGRLLGNLMNGDGISAGAIIPIPLSRTRLKERGFNQAELIASEVSSILKIPLLTDVLKRTKDTMRQTELSDNLQRSLNMSGAFAVNEDYDIEGLDIILIDDVATTGHTLHEAAVTLLKKGASSVLCCALCGNRTALNDEPY